MDRILQVILIVISFLFFISIISMVRDRRLELKYTLVWIAASICFLVFSIFPGVLKFISRVLHIIEPVNTVYLIVLFFLIVIVFTMTIAISRNANRVKTLTQEIGILKLKIDELASMNPTHNR